MIMGYADRASSLTNASAAKEGFTGLTLNMEGNHARWRGRASNPFLDLFVAELFWPKSVTSHISSL
ncbi:conserved protein of unknown function [Pseudomonas marincola]|uniref:Uncharacterized protein n=1 Tax=Pseudomonas marincola TaxID=437900 RepID=A0A653E3T0_9PSED|nr:conserved protein of unknown function [Pseudomonas marincola]